MNKKIISIVMVVMMCISINLFSTNVYAAPTADSGGSATSSWTTVNPDSYKPGRMEGADRVKDMGNVIIGTIQIIGTILSVIVLVVLGIKYMVGSVEEKASYKKSMMPYVLGAVMVFAITNLLGIIVNITNNLNSL